MTVGSFCPSCGAVVRPAALYCSSCGAAAGTTAAAPPVPPPFTVGTVGALVGGDQPVGAGQQAAVPGAVPVGQHPGAGVTFRYPPFGRRVGAFVIDTVPVLIVVALLWVYWPGDPSTLWWVLLGGVAVVLLGAALVLAGLGRSPGSAVWGLRVVREQTGGAPGPAGVGRLLLKYLLLIGTLTVAGFSPLWDGERRGRAWWDKIVGTVVVDLVRARPAQDAPAAAVGAPATAGSVVATAQTPTWDIPAPPASATRKGAAALAVWSDRTDRTDRTDRDRRLSSTPVASTDLAEHPWSGAVTPSTELITAVPGRETSCPVGPAPAQDPTAPQLFSPGSAESQDSGASAPDPTPVPDRDLSPEQNPADEPLDHTRMATRSTAPNPKWQLTFDDDRTLPLDGPLIVGRNPSVAPDESGAAVLALVDEDRSVSKTHLRIDVRDGGVVVTDRHSTNGVSVRTGTTTSQCVPGVPTAVPDGSTVRFGDREFIVRRG